MVVRTCEYCGEEFSTPQWRINQGRGRFCSAGCRDKSTRGPGVERGGLWYGEEKASGYLYCKTTCEYLHRHVWAEANGCIPDGWVVHHTDHDRGNNHLDNLACMPAADHTAHHAKCRAECGEVQGFSRAARTAAAAWHGSAEGKAWHSAHAKRSWAGRSSETHECAHCGGEYQAKRGARKRGFCSASCQGAARVASGVDDETRLCAICARAFRVNKYRKKKTCSESCRRAALRGPRAGV